MSPRRSSFSNLLQAWLLGLAMLGAGGALAQDAAALKARHAALAGQLANNPFKRPLVLESVEASGELKGEVYAVLEQPLPASRSR